MSKIILIRHAESLANCDASAYQWPDCANILSRHGVEQALILRNKIPGLIQEHFNGEPFKVITSDLSRAKITGQVAMSIFPHAQLLHDQRITECTENDYGMLVETHTSVKHRFRELLEEHDGNLILFTHCNAVRMLLGRILKNTEHIVIDRKMLTKNLPRAPKILIASN